MTASPPLYVCTVHVGFWPMACPLVLIPKRRWNPRPSSPSVVTVVFVIRHFNTQPAYRSRPPGIRIQSALAKIYPTNSIFSLNRYPPTGWILCAPNSLTTSIFIISMPPSLDYRFIESGISQSGWLQESLTPRKRLFELGIIPREFSLIRLPA